MKYFLILMVVISGNTLAQSRKLPDIQLDRRADTRYVDSLITLGKIYWQQLATLKTNPATDTAKLEVLAYLTTMFRYRAGRRDSVLHYADRLVVLAQQLKQPAYQIKGLYYSALYYQITQPNYPRALQYCHSALRLMEPNPSLQIEKWRLKQLMGEIFIKLEQYPKALASLKEVQHELESLNLSQKAAIDKFSFHYANVLQQLGNTYRIVKHFEQSEKYLLAATAQIAATQSATSLYYLYSDLAELYFYTQQYDRANTYYLKAEVEAIKLNNLNQKRYVWAWLAAVQNKLNKHELALEYAQKSITQGSLLITQLIGNRVLGEVYEAKKDWEKALIHYKEFNRISDTLLIRRQLTESINLQNQFEINQLALRSQQAQEIQTQKLLAVQRQAEIEKLRAKAQNDALMAQNNETQLKQRLETQALKTQAQRIQSNQLNRIKELEINELNQSISLQKRTQNFLILGVGLLLLLVASVFWYNRKLKLKNQALAIKNQEISEALLRGQTTERKRVAAELHDNIGGLLGALKMTINTLDTNLLRPQEKDIYGHILAMIDEANAQVRTLSHNLLPEELEKFGLVPSLEKLVGQLNLSQKTRFLLEISGIEKSLSKETEFNLYAIVLELCNNICKHAHATEATVELVRSNGQFKLIVSDNGLGFEQSNDPKMGMGLKNLQARAQAIGGVLKIRSQKGEGTLVSVVLT